MENKPLIFISHASEDRNIAFRTVEALENENIKCWIAPRDIPGGHNHARHVCDPEFVRPIARCGMAPIRGDHRGIRRKSRMFRPLV